jgi:hypothetical protein
MATFGFLMFNATAVFGPWYWRPILMAFVIIVVARRFATGR